MAILNIQANDLGSVGFPITPWLIETDDTLATVTTTGYLNSAASSNLFSNEDFAAVYTTDKKTIFLQIAISGANTSLVSPYDPASSGVTYSGTLVDGDFAVYDGATGIIKDEGYLPSDATKTSVVMASAAVVANRIACFSDTAGTINDDASTAVNNGNLQLGSSGTAGYGDFFPSTASKGRLRVAAVDNTGNTITTISNAAMGQASVVSIPDPGAATANFLLDSGTNTMAAGSRIIMAKTTATEAANAVTTNGATGVITTSALTTAAGAAYSITWTNSAISSTSTILLSNMGGTNTRLNISFRATAGSGTSTLNIYNNEPTNALNGTIILGFAIL